MSTAINPYQASMPTAAEPITVLAPGRACFGVKAASLSWRLPIAAVVVQIFSGILRIATGENLAVGAVLVCLFTMVYLLGLVMAVIALCSVPRHGWRRLLIPACAGLLLNGAVLSFLVYGIAVGMMMAQRGAHP
jgi:hypothetical protein